ncbi:ATP-binding cassette domain-containing protein [Staphylococcus sp. HMSC62A08]|uniref:ATP-binding cassette domain-containing protein n=1 Tax=Staphylococcus sp. HMSC62A08 TaxID=1608883 RepID=UPI0008A89ED3|nr:ATP-binding cassette domain-containing protein [Staphylococcus sp. HMSC62A08]OHS38933.1 ABC transporter ATP-binding protein [Staphylococcus sp. HMSC62A08]
MPNHQQKDNEINHILKVEELNIYHIEQPLIKSVALDVGRGNFHCIIGESGSGKSLLTRTILGMEKASLTYEGHVEINLDKTDAMFQDVHSNLFQNMTLEKHFQYLYEATQSNLSQQQRNAEVVQMLQMLGFDNGEELLNYYPFELSGGMAQRVAFIMSLIRQPECLVLDEPTSVLDKENSDKFMRYLIDAVNRYNMTIIFVTHDLNLVRTYATHISMMQHGEIIESGKATTILENPKHDYTKKLISIAQRRRNDA